jgi:serine/threonine-protein kinase
MNPSAVGRFLRECSILKSLEHPQIVACLEAGEARGFLWLAMEYIPGLNGVEWVQQRGPRTVREAIQLLLPVLDALSYAHSKGFVHRDVKPANLLLREQAGHMTAYLADFGLARTYQNTELSGLTLTGVAAGSPPFMPPEQVTNFRKVKPAGDQYSAAATLYYLLTGRFLFQFETPSELLQKVLQEDPVPLQQHRNDIPSELAAVFGRALSRRRQDRYPSIQAFAEALRPFGR